MTQCVSGAEVVVVLATLFWLTRGSIRSRYPHQLVAVNWVGRCIILSRIQAPLHAR